MQTIFFQALTAQAQSIYQVTMPKNLNDTLAWVAELEGILQLQTPFVMLYPPMPVPEAGEDDQASRKALILWIKSHKDQLMQYCKGMVVTAEDNPESLAFLEQTCPMLKVVYGVEAYIAKNENAALQQSQALLVA